MGIVPPAAQDDLIGVVTTDHREFDLEGVATDLQFDDLVGSVIAEVRHHMHAEEETFLPRLRDVYGAEELLELGRMMLRARNPRRPGCIRQRRTGRRRTWSSDPGSA